MNALVRTARTDNVGIRNLTLRWLGHGTVLRLVLVSHLHLDRLDLGSLRRLPENARLVGPLGAGPLLRRAHRGDVTEVTPGTVRRDLFDGPGERFARLAAVAGP